MTEGLLNKHERDFTSKLTISPQDVYTTAQLCSIGELICKLVAIEAKVIRDLGDIRAIFRSNKEWVAADKIRSFMQTKEIMFFDGKTEKGVETKYIANIEKNIEKLDDIIVDYQNMTNAKRDLFEQVDEIKCSSTEVWNLYCRVHKSTGDLLQSIHE